MIDTNTDIINVGYNIRGSIQITDPTTGEILVAKNNAINYEAMSVALADSLSDRGRGTIYQMAFGNGGTSVDSTGVITYLPPNVTSLNASLYNPTYAKVVDDNSVFNLNPGNNLMTVVHTPGTTYSDIIVTCLLDYGEPAGQNAFDNGTDLTSAYVFDELGLQAYYGIDGSGEPITRLLTHVVFHPIQKSLNRQIQIDYTIRIQSLTNLITSS